MSVQAGVEADIQACDVLVVGYGAAGATAAIEAAEAGASVVVLERASAPGGSSALSGGELYLGGGTSVQEACGFSDSAEAMYTFLVAALGPHADQEKLRHYCDGSVEHFDWLVAHGMPFTPSLYDGPTWMPHTADGLMWLGENAWPFNASSSEPPAHGAPAPRGHRGPTAFYAGKILMDTLVVAGEAAGVVTHADTRVMSLIVEDDRVVGVRARRFGVDVVYRARAGVVLTTGGFVDNEAMLADHAPALLGRGKVSDGLDDGSGITMSLEIGAATRRMGAYETALTYLPALACRGMIVDADGQRFINEDAYPGIVSHAAADHRRGPFWVIVDETGLDQVTGSELWGVRPSHAAETLAELEVELGMAVGSLEATVSAYNRDAEAGADRFHKDPRWLRVLTGPFAAIDVAAGFFGGEGGGNGDGVAGFTLGGLRTTPDGAVTRWDGSLILGLFAAGRVTSGIHGDGYISGTSLGDGTFFGRRAGRAAASQLIGSNTHHG